MHKIGLSFAKNLDGYGYNFSDKYIWRVDENYLEDNGFGDGQQEWGIIFVSAITGEYLGGVFSVNVKENEILETIVLLNPNPVTDFLNISIENKNACTSIQIYNLFGQKLLESEYKEQINVSRLTSGIYFLKINNVIYKFVKM